MIIISFEYEAALEQQHLTNPLAGHHATPNTKIKLELKWTLLGLSLFYHKVVGMAQW